MGLFHGNTPSIGGVLFLVMLLHVELCLCALVGWLFVPMALITLVMGVAYTIAFCAKCGWFD